MFTGLIEDVGVVADVAVSSAGREFRIESSYEALIAGESIAVNGACLTVLEHGAGWFNVAAVTTTLGRTTIGEWNAGHRVNLERALRIGDRLGGHFVQGHVDGVASVVDVHGLGDAKLVDLALPPGLAELMVQHGSVTVDGVSLTVARLGAGRQAGDKVHLEADMLGKYVQRLLKESTWFSER